MNTLRFHTWMMRNKKVSRDFEISAGASLYALAKAVVAAYGFDFDHCFGFFSDITEGRYHDSKEQYELFTDLPDVEPTGAGSVKKTKCKDVWIEPGKRMMMLFDYGDGWRFVIESMGSGTVAKGAKLPRVLAQSGRAPRQY
ncbi:hypothetical protein A3F28_02690 [Candidatus Uhrbacteria bacterium RIFCSPHIGHO2_12_FULL_57_11]|uniref:Plasmid pRiA4b Orf3-like domain-containing protein n=3 Tax=Parcubacteria group TaxID=1794811 RepID=A0A1F7UIH9_9BACT|nr:MAG: hypothetical protein A2704_04050 [Candidatus Kaiserbacteria bacterium RIFCSPHIGHO2_01_FULL_54_36b]OGL73207.1 MAG: hypothetical protein A3D72_04440 [Candidatus Uhrbacteria bacterium RIFCSPHIGHO2_02_FULL_57_19]OGL77538.1 MAG: hypothetical protein A3F28_02690 [Candidatus Uhrbacteria bacterium RIFCSPHIGHO2_12_FULL_57_11]